ncbi:hypothetical protein ACFV27_31210 [Streptomyces antimycoticus]|uniref:Uncharacterized protein n=3 Tax=Streptomyces TaxID=1883 RepID=A0ABD5J8F9_9ACTN|nr:hypothetical protein [Streptomyces violaceusniger]KUL43174.1 hypothetical protein ADL28_43030 [Streptomyces violaceusniger]MEE4584623.1 hypothetical protein [Streptomyces sp. DSM 41602]
MPGHYGPWPGTTLVRAVRLQGDHLELTATTRDGSRLLIQWRTAGAARLRMVLEVARSLPG